MVCSVCSTTKFVGLFSLINVIVPAPSALMASMVSIQSIPLRKNCGLAQISTVPLLQPTLHPVEDGRYYLRVKLVADHEAVSHAVNFHITRATGMDLVDSRNDRFAICPTHNGVASPSEHQHRRIHPLPDCAQIERL